MTKLLSDEGYTCGLVGKLHLTSAEGRVEKRCDDGYSYFQYSHHPHKDWKDGGNDYQNWLNEKGVHWEEIYGGKFMTMATWPPQAQSLVFREAGGRSRTVSSDDMVCGEDDRFY